MKKSKAAVQRCSVKKIFLKILQNLLENIQACNFIKKETLTQGFPVSFAKFQEHLPLYNSSSGCLWKAKGLKAEYKLILQM